MGYSIKIEKLEGQPDKVEMYGVDPSVGGYRFEQRQIERLCQTILLMIAITGQRKLNGETDQTAAE